MEKEVARRHIYLHLPQESMQHLYTLATNERRDLTNVATILVEWALLQLRGEVREGGLNLSGMIEQLGAATQQRQAEIVGALTLKR
jgi:hypothetical protein